MGVGYPGTRNHVGKTVIEGKEVQDAGGQEGRMISKYGLKVQGEVIPSIKPEKMLGKMIQCITE